MPCHFCVKDVNFQMVCHVQCATSMWKLRNMKCLNSWMSNISFFLGGNGRKNILSSAVFFFVSFIRRKGSYCIMKPLLLFDLFSMYCTFKMQLVYVYFFSKDFLREMTNGMCSWHIYFVFSQEALSNVLGLYKNCNFYKVKRSDLRVYFECLCSLVWTKALRLKHKDI